MSEVAEFYGLSAGGVNSGCGCRTEPAGAAQAGLKPALPGPRTTGAAEVAGVEAVAVDAGGQPAHWNRLFPGVQAAIEKRSDLASLRIIEPEG
jgi:hypothetical protein